MEKELKTGTTTLGMVCKSSVVMAAEHRATMGTLIAHKTTQKIFKIDNHLALTTAGLVGDAQLLARWLTAEAELYNLKRNQEMTVKAAATLMANILSGRRYFPYWVQLLVGGIDLDGGHVYSLDAAGGAIPDNYITTGSGSPYVYGILEDYYEENMSNDEGINLAIRAIHAAMKRDAASGNGIDVVLIEKKGYQEYTKDQINQRIKKMGLKNE
jgi:proteasome beta subunit